MNLIKVEEIDVSGRVRKAFDEEAIARLSDSIGRIGLLHAPILDNGKLIAGERRLRAIAMLALFNQPLLYQGKEIPRGQVPYTELAGRDPLHAMEAELEENTHREDLTPQEEASARANLHRLRLAQNPAQTKTATAAELSTENKTLVATDIRDALLIDEHLGDPEVATAKTHKDAMKVIERKLRAQQNALLAKQFQQTHAATSPHRLFNGRCEDVLPQIEDNSIDVILTDPPYGIDAQDFNAQDGITHQYDDTRATFESIIEAVAREGSRICKPRAHVYIFHDFGNFGFIRERMEAHGFNCWPRPLIWVKGNGLLARPNHGPRYTYECILFANRGDRETTQVLGDCITIRTLTKQRRGAEKPASLYHNLLGRSVRPGDAVLDPCCGLGPIFPAANKLNCRAIGIEPDIEACDVASLRFRNTLRRDHNSHNDEWEEINHDS